MIESVFIQFMALCVVFDCGKANGPGADPNSRAIQSMVTNEFPWLVYLYFDNSDEDYVWCSGSIIGTKWILTAASCLDVYRYNKRDLYY